MARRLLLLSCLVASFWTLEAERSEAQVTLQNCPQNPLCRIVTDADADGEISDDLRAARNELLYASGATSSQSVYLFPPAAGTYDWNGIVRFCGDDTPPTGQSEPDCDGTAELPKIVFAGAWSNVLLETSCADDDTMYGVTGCLHIGDRMLGDGGDLEPRVSVLTHQVMQFQHVAVFPGEYWYLIENFHPVYAVWLDGVEDSIVAVQVGRDISDRPYLSGSGVYASATESLVVATLLGDPTEGGLVNGLVLDGVMSGSHVIGNADLSAASSGMDPNFMIGTSGGCFLFFCSAANGPDDGCAYGPDPAQSCRDFSAELTLRTPANSLGGDGLFVADGDDIELELDFEYLTAGHAPLKFQAAPPGPTDDFTVTGAVLYRGWNDPETAQYPAVQPGAGDILLDLPIQSTVWPSPTCIGTGGAGTVSYGSSYQCLGTP